MSMRPLVLGIAVVAAGAAFASGAESPPPPPAATTAVPADLEPLAGRWQVDLRPAPEAPEYLKTMSLTIAGDRTVRGSFYDSEIESGRASASNGRVCFAFRTTDGAGPYHTSGCLVGDRILGQTWAEHRQFLLNWSAMRER